MSNGWEYSVPRWIGYQPDMTVIEWNGIDPDIFVEWETDGTYDPVLDRAIQWVNEQIAQ